MEKLVKELTEKKLTIASCESLTGGLFASSIVDVSGASKVFVGAYVTYMDKAKEILLDGKTILEKYGAISKEMACLMALKVQEKFSSDIAISFTGNAGPLPSENKEVGLVYSCIVIKDKIYTFKNVYKGNRKEIRNQCIEDGKNKILALINKNIEN